MTWRVFWAIVLILVGVVFLLINLGVLPGSAWNYIFPAILVILGLLILTGMRGGRGEVVNDSAALDGATRGALHLKHGAGRLNVRAGASPSNLFEGTFGGGIDKRVTRRGDELRVELQGRADTMPFMFGGRGMLDWDVALNSSVPLALKLDGGATDSHLDLSGLALGDLEINTGASSTQVTLPTPNGTLHATIHAGAASVQVAVPPGVPARILGTMGLGALDIDQSRFPQQSGSGVPGLVTSKALYESNDFATAANRVEITIEGGVGSVRVR